MKSKILLMGVIIFMVAVLLNPFIWVLCGSTHFREKVIEQLVYKTLVSKTTHEITSDREKAIKLFDYIDTHIFHKKMMEIAALDVHFLKHLITGTGYCNQQALILMDLTKKVNIKARVLYLRGYDSVSHHSVCDLYINDKFRIFDSDFGYIFISDGEIATFLDIQKDRKKVRSEKFDSLLFLNKGFDATDYFKLYEPTYEFIIANTNFKLHLGRMLRAGVIDLYYDIFGDQFLIFLQDLYFKVANVDLLLKARLKHLSSRFRSALIDYNDIMNGSTDSLIRSESSFFRGQLFWDMKDFDRCISTFEELLKVDPENRWRDEIYFYLGDAYENIKKFDKAAFYYSKIKDSHTTPAPTRLIELITDLGEKEVGRDRTDGIETSIKDLKSR